MPGFGAGFEIAPEPSKLQKEVEKPWKKGKRHFYFLRQTSGMQRTLAQKRSEIAKLILWISPKPIPDKANHPSFPHIQCIQYAERADHPRKCGKTLQKQQNRGRQNRKCGTCGRSARENTEKWEIRKGDFVRGGGCLVARAIRANRFARIIRN